MGTALSVAARTAYLNALVTEAGAGALVEFYGGTRPAGAADSTSPTGTLLGTLTAGSTLGTVSAGVLTFGSFTQSNGSHVNGTPGYVRIRKAGGSAPSNGVAMIDIGAGAGNWQFSGTIVTGQNITVTTPLTWTGGNAT
jgi:hypothetical protein